MQWKLILQRKSVNRISDEKGIKQLKKIKRAVERNQTLGFRCRMPSSLPEPEELRSVEQAISPNRWSYTVNAVVLKDNFRSEDTAEKYFSHILSMAQKTGNLLGWSVDVAETDAPVATGDQAQAEEVWKARLPLVLPELSDVAKSSFWPGVFERDAHIRVVHRAVASFLETNREERSHVLLYGLPAGCKSTVFKGLKAFYEQSDPTVERVTMFDATTLTKAGLENWLLNRAAKQALPEIICLEEIEKHKPENLLSLLSVMASGEIMRTNCKVGHAKADAKVLVWATCNDEQTLKNFHRGALWSRFSHQLHCARPTRSLMEKILAHKIQKLPGGNQEWVGPILRFAYDEIGNDDPRFIVGLLDGREGILDGSYFGDLLAIERAKHEEEQRRTVAA